MDDELEPKEDGNMPEDADLSELDLELDNEEGNFDGGDFSSYQF